MSVIETNIEKIEQVQQSGWQNVYLSSSEACMVALALCMPEILQHQRLSAAEAWRRIDKQQMDIVTSWARPAMLGRLLRNLS
jgi:hypothetical protein